MGRGVRPLSQLGYTGRRAALARTVLAALMLASMLAMPAASAEPMLYPDLVSSAPRNPAAPTVIVFGERTFLGVRFDGLIANIGEGPLDLYGDPSAGTVAQRVRSGEDWVEVGNPPVLYETADLHNHWHLMRITRFSLWNENRSAEVAPGEKVGFCLYDIEPAAGAPPAPAYYEGPVVQWCQAGNPNATELRMGISAGWADVYSQGLTFQWVDVSDVAPGTYWLANEIDPENVIVEADEANNTLAFAATPTVVPGYLAQPVGPVAVDGPSKTITLDATTHGAPGPRRFRIVSPPQHGTLSVATGVAFAGPTVQYAPDPGYVGSDAFTYVAVDQASPYPLQPPAAAVTLNVSESPDVSVSISGAPAAMIVGTSVQLTATVTNASPSVQWTVDGIPGGSMSVGTITTAGLYTAPAMVPTGGSVTIRATSSDHEWAYDEVTIAIDPGQQAPVVSNPGPQQHSVGEAPRLQIIASDPDGDPLTYSASNLPPGLTIHALTGMVFGTPTTPGQWEVTVTASDGQSTGSTTFMWTVTAAPPVIAPLSDVTVDEGQVMTLALDISDPQGFDFICTLIGPGYVTKNAANTLLTIAPGFADAGSAVVTVTATNDQGAAASETLTVTVRNVNRAPALGALSPVELDEGGVLHIDPGATDPDGDPLSLAVSGAPFVSVDADTGEVVLAPGFDDAGTHSIAVTATDPAGAAVTAVFVATIADVNRPPDLSVVSSVTVAEGSLASVPFAASDPDGDPVTVTVSGAAFARRDGASIALSPGYEDAGDHTVVVRADDDRGPGQTRVLQVTVTNTNRLPVVAPLAAQRVAEGDSLVVPLTATDPDGETLALSVGGAGFASIVDGDLFLEPGFDDAGVWTLTVTAADPAGAAGSTTVSVTVDNVNRAPLLEIPAAVSVPEGDVAVVPIVASDPDGDALVYVVDGPGWVSIDEAALRVAPGFADAGAADVTVRAIDEGGLSAVATIRVTVPNVNRAPVLSMDDEVAVLENATAELTVTATDPDGDPLSLSVDAPSWATLAGEVLRLNPGFADAGEYTIVVSAADPGGLVASAAVLVTVGDVNRPPIVSVPASLSMTVGEVLDVAVVVTDPDGETTTLEVAGPAFAALGDGVLRLTPGDGDVGAHQLIVVARDGRDGVTQRTIELQVLPVNAAPHAVIHTDLPRVAVPVVVRFNGFRSIDPEGARLRFAWDLDGDGAFDDSRHPRPTWIFLTGGSHVVKLRVTDAAGNVDVAAITLELGGATGVRTVRPAVPPAPGSAPGAGEAPGPGGEPGGSTVMQWGGSDDEVVVEPGRIYLL